MPTYEVTLTRDCGPYSWSFTVAEAGAPTTVSPNGSVFSVDLTDGVFIEPGGDTIGPLVADLIGNIELLLAVTAEPTTVIPMILAGSDGSGGQDVCVATQEPTVDPLYEEPYFLVEDQGLTLPLSDGAMTLADYELSGAFAADLSTIQGGVFRTVIDTRHLKTAIGLGASAPDDAVCGVLGAVGLSCEECPDGSGPYCLPYWVTDIEGSNVGGSIVPISAAEAALNCP